MRSYQVGRAIALGVLLMSTSASAIAPRGTTGSHQRARLQRPVADTLTAMPAAGLGQKPLRASPTLEFNHRTSRAWARFAMSAGLTWRAAWDRATGVPTRMWGKGITVPGANNSPAIAASAARQWLGAHLDLLAPGASMSDFVLVSNHSDGDQRSIGFVQMSGGRRVVGGQVSFRFKNDRLFVIGSEALPNVTVPPSPRARLRTVELARRATANLRAQLALPAAPVKALGDEVVLPLVGDVAVYGYRVAVPFEIDGGADGRYLAYVDPTTGEALAVRQQNMYANGTVLYRTVDRHPHRGRLDRPAHRAHLTVAGAAQTSSGSGGITWSPDTAQTVTVAPLGDLSAVVNKAGEGELAGSDLTISPSGIVVWDESTDEKLDAQLVAFVSVNTVKEYVRANLDPDMPTLDDPMTTNVNLPNNCNAFYDGKAINFFIANENCENTARIEDVVYHEFGHHVHASEIIEGVGAFDGAMSEGAADTLATMITNDSGMGRGFFLTDDPLRELDPPDSEATFPNDVGEIHTTGIIYGGAFFDLRKALFATYGEAIGRPLLSKLFLATLRRSSSIQTALIEVLAADDDDGDLSNGTPNECIIRDAFGRHGLRTATGSILAPGVLDENALSTVVRLDLEGLSSQCTGDEIDSIRLDWKPGFTASPAPGAVLMTKVSSTRYFAQMPLAINGTTIFEAVIRFTDGSKLTLADNFADPYYMIYQGSTVPLYCIDFDQTNPFADGWTTGTGDGSESPWEYGEPPGTGATDPPTAYTGSKIVAQVLGGDYNPKQYSFLQMPPIDVRQYSDVHLQYRRWLAVEDSEFDKARVTVGGRQAFINLTENKGQRSSTHHIDREWRFQDLAVSGYTFGHTIDIRWDLQSDEGLQLGGWALDDVCVVANRRSICGDGFHGAFEQCDDGPDNADAPNKCRTYCLLPTCGDGIVDDGEQCDEGPDGTDTCSAACELLEPTDTGGCCSSSRDSGGGAFALGALVGLVGLRRRRR